MKQSIHYIPLVLILLAGCQRSWVTTASNPKPTAIPTATASRIVNGHVYPIFQDRCPQTPEVNLAEMGITQSDRLVTYDGDKDYNQDGISIYSLLDDSITHIDGTELPVEWDEQWFIPGPGEDSVTMIRKDWGQDLSKLWVINLKTKGMTELLSDQARYRDFRWKSRTDLLVTGVNDVGPDGTKYEFYYPIALIDTTNHIRHDYPQITDYTDDYVTGITTHLDGDHLFEIYYEMTNPGVGQLFLFDYESYQITPIFPWITDQAEFNDSSFLLTHLGIEYDPASESYDIFLIRGPDGFDIARDLTYSD